VARRSGEASLLEGAVDSIANAASHDPSREAFPNAAPVGVGRLSDLGDNSIVDVHDAQGVAYDRVDFPRSFDLKIACDRGRGPRWRRRPRPVRYALAMVDELRRTPHEHARERAECGDAHGETVVSIREALLASEALASVAHELSAHLVAAEGKPSEVAEASPEDKEYARQLAIDCLHVALGGGAPRAIIDRIHHLRFEQEHAQEPFDFQSLIAFLDRRKRDLAFPRGTPGDDETEVRKALELVALLSPERRRQLDALSGAKKESLISAIVARIQSKTRKARRGRPIEGRAKAEILYEELGWALPPKPRKPKGTEAGTRQTGEEASSIVATTAAETVSQPGRTPG
jgi:hypothetical protein